MLLLRALGSRRAAKVIGVDSAGTQKVVSAYDLGFRFDSEECEDPNNVEDLFNLLDLLREDPSLFVVRGELKTTYDEPIRRISRGPQATIRDRSRAWICVDLDKTNLKLSQFPDVESAMLEARAALPLALRSAKCVWRASSSCGLQDQVKAHLWFILDRPASDQQLRTWAKGAGVDGSVFSAVQPIYTSDPIFVDTVDPLTSRIGILPGDSERVDAISLLGSDRELDVHRDRAHNLLKRAAKELASATPGDRHSIANRYAYRLGQLCPHFLEEAAIKERLYAAADKCGMSLDRLSEIDRAVRDGMAAPDDPTSDFRAGLTLSKEGNIRNTAGNLVSILESDPAWAGALTYDQSRVQWLINAPFDGRGVRDIETSDYEYTARWLEQRYKTAWAPLSIGPTLYSVASNNGFHPLRQYLEELEHDGEPRIDTWLTRYCGVEDSRLAREYARRWLISAVARCLEPGCQADHMLILEGSGGKGKSTAFQILANGYYSTLPSDIHAKDTAIQLQSSWIVDNSELDAMKKAERSAMYDFITRRVDHYRQPYDRTVKSHPRKIVLCGTTNDRVYLTNGPGDRRFWSVYSQNPLDLPALARDKDQIWAEAVQAYRAGEPWHIENREIIAESAAANAERSSSDPWLPVLRDYFQTGKGKDCGQVDPTLLLRNLFLIPVGQIHNGYALRLNQILSLLGWTKKGELWERP